MKKVLVTERISDLGINILKEKVQLDVKVGIDRRELLEIIGDYHGLVVRSETKADKELFEYANKLVVVGRAGNGIDNIDVDAATTKGVIVANTPESNIVAAAEHTIALMLTSARNIPQANTFIKGGDWGRTRFNGVEFLDKTVGIIGLGKIGSLVATRLKAFRMRVIAYDPYIPDERFEKFGAEKVEKLEDLLTVSDFITIHTPKTKETFNMISDKEFALMKDGVRIVNCARGGLFNEEALARAIETKKVASAALDVFVQEPSYNNPLFKYDNIIVTPHMGASTFEAQDNVGSMIASQVLAALDGDVVPNAVNLPSLPHSELREIEPYLKLAETMGKIYYQIEKEPIQYIVMEYTGDIAAKNTEIITRCFLKGILEPVVGEKVNYVNSPLLAQTRGIRFEEATGNGITRYKSLIRLKIQNKNTTVSVSGTIYGKDEPKLVEINQYSIDLTPAQYMLMAKNIDRPGMIGKVGTILGNSEVNIASMQVGRKIKGDKALMVLSVDSPIPDEVLQEIEKVDGILSQRFIRL